MQQTDDAPDRWRGIFDEIDAMVADGLDVRAQVAPRPVGAMLSFASTTNPFILTPTYRADQRRRRRRRGCAQLADPQVRERILAEHGAYPARAASPAQLTNGFERMFRMTDPVDYEPTPEASIAAEAKRTNKSPGRALLRRDAGGRAAGACSTCR